MQAAAGDTITVKAIHQGESDPARRDHRGPRQGRATALRGVVADDRESLFFPAAGTVVEHHSAGVQSAAPS